MRAVTARRVTLPLALVLGLVAAATSRAQAPSPTPAAPPPIVETAGGSDTVATAAGRDYLAEIRASFTPENKRYSDIKTVLRFSTPLIGILVAFLVLFTGLSGRMRDVAHAMGSRRYVRVLVYLALFSVVIFVLLFPLSFYDDFVVEHQFGLSTQSFASYMGDQGKALLATIVFLGVVPIVWLAYTLIAKSPKRWWLWLGLASLPLIAATSLLQPLVFEPLFNKFTRLRDPVLERQILDLAAKAQIPGRKVLESDQSTKTKKYNAYVSGFGASQRIVLWDTTLKGMKSDEILYVMGHEMGHYKLGHIWKGILVSAGVSLALFFGGGLLSLWLLRRYGRRWGFDSLADVASMPLLLLTVNLVSFAVQPLIYTYTRGIETEADVYGLEITHDNDAAARAFLKLGAQNKSNPDPSAFVKTMLYSHPPDGERMRLALEYKPWVEGKPNKYFKGATAPRATSGR